jgi:hypothetical protein
MKRALVVNCAIAFFAVAAAACVGTHENQDSRRSEQSEPSTMKSREPPPEPPAAPAAPSVDLDPPAEQAAEKKAEQEIARTNYKSALAKIEKEIGGR